MQDEGALSKGLEYVLYEILGEDDYFPRIDLEMLKTKIGQYRILVVIEEIIETDVLVGYCRVCRVSQEVCCKFNFVWKNTW